MENRITNTNTIVNQIDDENVIASAMNVIIPYQGEGNPLGGTYSPIDLRNRLQVGINMGGNRLPILRDRLDSNNIRNISESDDNRNTFLQLIDSNSNSEDISNTVLSMNSQYSDIIRNIDPVIGNIIFSNIESRDLLNFIHHFTNMDQEEIIRNFGRIANTFLYYNYGLNENTTDIAELFINDLRRSYEFIYRRYSLNSIEGSVSYINLSGFIEQIQDSLNRSTINNVESVIENVERENEINQISSLSENDRITENTVQRLNNIQWRNRNTFLSISAVIGLLGILSQGGYINVSSVLGSIGMFTTTLGSANTVVTTASDPRLRDVYDILIKKIYEILK